MTFMFGHLHTYARDHIYYGEFPWVCALLTTKHPVSNEEKFTYFLNAADKDPYLSIENLLLWLRYGSIKFARGFASMCIWLHSGLLSGADSIRWTVDHMKATMTRFSNFRCGRPEAVLVNGQISRREIVWLWGSTRLSGKGRFWYLKERRFRAVTQTENFKK